MNDSRPNYLQGNVDAWQEKAADYAAEAERAWASDQPYWGIWEIPERDDRLLPVDMSGLAAIELGCGTAYVSAWMRRRGARVVAIDPTPGQLETARRLRPRLLLLDPLVRLHRLDENSAAEISRRVKQEFGLEHHGGSPSDPAR